MPESGVCVEGVVGIRPRAREGGALVGGAWALLEAAPRYLSAMFFTEVVDRARPVIPRRPSPTVASNINGLLVQ